jgi:hypothetical protein
MALLIVIAAIGVVLWPLNSTGVTGNAFRPNYVAFGWSSYTPLPDHPTPAQLRAAGVPVPSDAVDSRRHLSETLALGSVVAALACVVRSRRRNPPRHLAVA